MTMTNEMKTILSNIAHFHDQATCLEQFRKLFKQFIHLYNW